MDLVVQSNFVVRKSGLREGYYIDYCGVYSTKGLAGLTGLNTETVEKIFFDCRAFYDDRQDLYYFESTEAAKNAIGQIFASVRADMKGKTVCLSEAEVEFIRRALINEGNNTIHLKSRIKDEIFRKLNG